MQREPTPRRRGPIYVAASAIVAGGYLGSAGVPAAAGALAVVGALAARRLRKPAGRRLAAFAFALLAAILALAAVLSLPDATAGAAPFFALLASAGGLVAFVAAVRYDDRLRTEAIHDLLLPLDEVLARRGFGRGATERCIEVPFALARVGAAQRILECGYAFPEPFWLDALYRKKRADARVFGLDLVRRRIAGLAAVEGDLRAPPFREGAFDLVLCISTLEHVGRDNARYAKRFRAPGLVRIEGWEVVLATARALGRLVAPSGRLVLTVPFGRTADHGWLWNVSREDLSAIEAASGLEVAAEEFFIYEDGWRRARAAECADRDYGSHGARAASAVACVELRRAGGGDPEAARG
jgi:O-antigen chain-terminating methyltransferase